MPIRLEIPYAHVHNNDTLLEQLTYHCILRTARFCPSSAQHCKPKPSCKNDILSTYNGQVAPLGIFKAIQFIHQ